jgi:hypothetical protein
MVTTPKLLIGAIAAALAFAPAVSLPSAGAAKPSGPPKACFYARNVNGFSAPNEQTVYLRVSVRDVYEAKLFAPCNDVDWNQTIALRSRGSSWICEGSGANFVEVISHSAMGRQRCPVTSLRKLTPDEIAAIPKRDRP